MLILTSDNMYIPHQCDRQAEGYHTFRATQTRLPFGPLSGCAGGISKICGLLRVRAAKPAWPSVASYSGVPCEENGTNIPIYSSRSVSSHSICTPRTYVYFKN